MTAISDLDIAALETATAPYRDALYHRNTFLEGIRQIAIRNLAHRHRTAAACGYADRQTEGRMDPVSARMLEDQGLEDSQGNRDILPIVTFVPVQIYLCMLYASIEFYQETSAKHVLYKDRALDDCIARHAEVIATLVDFRHSFLHPTEDYEIVQKAFLETRASYNVAPELQAAFDAYLERARLKVIAYLQEELARLPTIQRLYCRLWAFPPIAERMTDCHDPDGLTRWKQALADDTDKLKQILEV